MSHRRAFVNAQAIRDIPSAPQRPFLCSLIRPVMASMSLADRFQAVTAQAKTEEFQKKSYDDLSKMTIAFGESKVGQTFQEVIQTDPKYVQWFTRKYGESQKETHRAFLYFINLYVERQELVQGVEEPAHQKPVVSHLALKAKSRAAPSNKLDIMSQGSWESEEGMPWIPEADHRHPIAEEVEIQGARITKIEDSLTVISQQLQALVTMTSQNHLPKS